MDYHITKTLTEHDNHQHIDHRFIVPVGATRLNIDFEYAPKRTGRYGNLLTLSLFDPLRERGTGHRGQPTQHVTLSRANATPGYRCGALEPGEWNLMVNTNLILPDAHVTYDIQITCDFADEPGAEAAVWTPGVTALRGPGWYRGDLHSHTIHSDGSWDVEGLVGFARTHQLDFITLTDHNTVSALDQMLSHSADDLLVMGGFELTTFYGHALALGLRDLIDWRVRGDQRTMPIIKQEIEGAGGLFVIAHPKAPGDPACTGCHWDYGDLMPGSAQVVEVWNEHWDSSSNNEEAVQLWYEWLNQGCRLVATVGTDIHGEPNPPRNFGFNIVFAESLSEPAILSAIRQGHLYISSGPRLTFTGQSAAGQTAMMGDTLAGEDCALTAQWLNCTAADRIRLIVDGEPYDEFPAQDAGEKSWALNGTHWAVVEIRDPQHNLLALTNPIFIG